MERPAENPASRVKQNIIKLSVLVACAAGLVAAMIIFQSPYLSGRAEKLTLVFNDEDSWKMVAENGISRGTPIIMRRETGDIEMIGKVAGVKPRFHSAVIFIQKRYRLKEGQIVESVFIEKPPAGPLAAAQAMVRLTAPRAENDESIPRNRRMHFLQFGFVLPEYDTGYRFSTDDAAILVENNILRRTAPLLDN